MQKRIHQERGMLEVEFGSLKTHIDGDADVEIEDLKSKYAQRLKSEEELVMSFMSEHAILKKSLQTLGM